MNHRVVSRPRRRARRRGVGMVELLIATAIVASLLTATAVAVNAAFEAYHVNQQQTLQLSKARVALAVLTSKVRGTRTHAPDSTTLRAQFATGATVTDTGITMYDEDDTILTFRYDAANKRLLAITPSATHVVARGVEAFSVTLEPMRSAQSIRTGGAWDLLRRATFTLTLNADVSAAPGEIGLAEPLTLSGSVMPRRNAW